MPRPTKTATPKEMPEFHRNNTMDAPGWVEVEAWPPQPVLPRRQVLLPLVPRPFLLTLVHAERNVSIRRRRLSLSRRSRACFILSLSFLAHPPYPSCPS